MRGRAAERGRAERSIIDELEGEEIRKRRGDEGVGVCVCVFCVFVCF